MRDTASATPTTADRPGILVVDDETIVVTLLQAALTHRGFQVWTAGSGRAAVELYRARKEHIAVVLLDVCMPEMDGPATLAELRRHGLTAPACFMSGFSARYSVDDLLSLGAARFFEKPFRLHELTGEVWELARPDRLRSA